jgi:hypothetical protein
MAYATDVETFASQVGAAIDFAGARPVWAGVGAYRLSAAETLRHIATARQLKAAGIALFSYDALVAPPNSVSTLAEIGRTAFGPGSLQ